MSDEQQQVAAVITVNDMYHELQGVRAGVQDLAGKFNDVPRALADHTAQLQLLANVPATLNDHEHRIRDLYNRKYVTPAALVTAVGVILTALGVVAAFMAVGH